MADDCIFCRILDGAAPASLVHEDDRCVAFLDLFPGNPGHLLVVPRAHAPALAELDPDVGAHLFRVGQRLAATLRQLDDVRCDGLNLFLSDGAVAGQEVWHVHLHVLPRFSDDGVRLSFGQTRRAADREDLDRIAARIRALATSRA